RHAEGDAPARRRAGRAGDEPAQPAARVPAARAAQSIEGNAPGGSGQAVRAAGGHGSGRDSSGRWKGQPFRSAGAPATDGNGRAAGASDERRGTQAPPRKEKERAPEQKEKPPPIDQIGNGFHSTAKPRRPRRFGWWRRGHHRGGSAATPKNFA